MSLYNALFGVNKLAPLLLSALGREPTAYGRFRDVYLTRYEGRPVIAVYTRNGGGNREHWNDERVEGEGCDCTGCTQKYAIPSMTGFIYDEDDEFDCTYATNYFEVPDDWMPILGPLADEAVPPGEKFQQLLEKMQRGDDDPEVQKALEVGRKILAPIIEAIKAET